MTIDDCLVEGKISKQDLNLGWVVWLENGWLKLSYTIRDFDWNTVQDASPEKVNQFLKSQAYLMMKEMLDEARKNRKTMFYQSSSIADMKQMLEADGVKVDLDKLIRAKARSLAVPKSY